MHEIVFSCRVSLDDWIFPLSNFYIDWNKRFFSGIFHAEDWSDLEVFCG